MASKRPHEGSSCEQGSITHRTLHVNAASLMEVVNDWITGLPSHKDQHEIPIVLVALHACGSLTPDTLRAFMEARRQRLGANDASHGWQFVAAVVVGCCYNLLRIEGMMLFIERLCFQSIKGLMVHLADFPLSRALKTMPMPTSLLSPSAYHLATHVPSHWFDTMKSSEAVALSVRKVVWRALLGRALESVDVTDTNQQSPDVNAIPSTSMKFNQVLVGNGTITQRKPAMGDENGGMGSNPLMRRLGRLPDSAYQDWATFIEKANQKLGVTLDVTTRPCSAFEEPTETQLETLYILRCLLGPVIETLLVRDRIEWIQEELATDVGHANIHAVNLFDQSSGSGRNVALVITS
ncbi:hypothetical protein ONZ45_g17646 [Pleurotus djamor]|nr:hypothetical protein ONZ45_g17646 [Pleurotus djamor]